MSSFWDNNKDSFKSAGIATIKGIGKGGKAIGNAGVSAYKGRNGSSTSTASEGPTNSFDTGTGPVLQKIDHSQLKSLPAPPRRNVGADGSPVPGVPPQSQPQPQPQAQYQPPQAPAQPAPAQPQLGYQTGHQPSTGADVPPPAYQQQNQTQQSQVPTPQYQNPSQPAPLPGRPVPAPPPRQSPAPSLSSRPSESVLGAAPAQPAQPPVAPPAISYENPYHQPPAPAPQLQPQYPPEALEQPQPTQPAPFRRAPAPLPPQSPLASPEPVASPAEEPEKPKKPLPDPKSFPPPVLHKDRAKLANSSTGESEKSISASNTGSSAATTGEPIEKPNPKKAYSLEIDRSFAPPPKPFRGPGEEVPPPKKAHQPAPYSPQAARSTPPPPSRGSGAPPLPSRGTSQNSLPPVQAKPLPILTDFPPPPKPFRLVAESPKNAPSPKATTAPEPPAPVRVENASELAKKKGPPPKPAKKSSLVVENSSQSPPPPYTEEETKKPVNSIPNFAEEIALRKRNSSTTSVKKQLNEEPLTEEAPPPKPARPLSGLSELPPPKTTRHLSSSSEVPPPKPARPQPAVEESPPPMPHRPSSRTESTTSGKPVKPEKPNKPEKPAKPEKPGKPGKLDKPGAKLSSEKPTINSQDEFINELHNNLKKTVPSSSEVAKEAVVEKKAPPKPKPLAKPKPEIPTKAPAIPPPRVASRNSGTPPPPPTPRIKSPPSGVATPPPPPPARNYKRAAAPEPVNLNPPDLDLELSTGWFANFAKAGILPQSLQGLNMKYSYQSSSMGSITRHQSNFSFRLKDLAIIVYNFTWTNDNYANVQVEILRYVPSPIVANIPSKSELVGYHQKFGEYVASWCEHKQGQKVGTGECWDLARDALLKGCGKHAFVSTGTHHGFPILSVSGSANGVVFNQDQLDDIRRGDVLQFERCSFYNAATGASLTAGDPDHTSVVIQNDGTKITVLEQNVGGVKIVVKGQVILKDLKAGKLTVYRPVPIEWAGEL
ncbi:uncharacterized protein CANTADRAFT_22859 [Suhomyces tanzawaensis NRRL Y-17324]|uniref:BBC1/AIM3 cysteine proteinase-fold domain-containing protein n=1 Tax=Suhomyces tanzawaensis NRRL Y-17324 TaxID=984487 RepID=A0A1E4SE05_9ASCO|nr:uncharacterized protein CANTADRAFT_22859 [Suhomyces tanzawaensis NRRL Y-17324]ODV77735.1 hypothetical protein CANTADRAFT_22859 [Suhomyces tanzawaensis NRRL Y-17324]